jgi:hypothetical protein
MPVSVSGSGSISGLATGWLPDGTVTTADLAFDSGPLSGARNRIINGDMRIDQRNAGASVTPNGVGQYLVDRFVFFATQNSKLTAQQNAGSITPPAGFSNYLGFTSTSAYSILSTDAFVVSQRIEGFNSADFAWGTADAKTVSLSFWVRSSLTGLFGGALRNSDDTRSYVFSYSINSANTWEYKTILIPGATSGTWATGNTPGIILIYGLAAGSSKSGTAGSWSTTTVSTAPDTITGSVSVVGTNGATWYITGVQLEAGSVATPFERRAYGAELALAQRYFQKVEWITTSLGGDGTYQNIGSLLVPMRANPTISSTYGDYTPVANNAFRQTNNLAFSGTQISATAEL